jgi:hypothetical protein
MPAVTRTGWLFALLIPCVAFLMVRELTRGDVGRYTVSPLRAGSPVLVRTDTRTGESWKLELRAGGERWTRIPNPGETTPIWEQRAAAPRIGAARPDDRPLARDEIKSLANAILGDELAPDIRMWAVGQLANTPDRQATLALIQLLDAVDEPKLVALIRKALELRDDPRARRALERSGSRSQPPAS